MGLFSFTQEIAMDLGTANTIILNNGKIVVVCTTSSLRLIAVPTR